MSLKSSLNLTEFGIAEETIDKIVERVQSHISGAYIPKERFDEVNNSLKQQKKMNATLSGQLEGLKDVDVESLNNKITELQNENKRQQTEFEKQMSAEKLNNALDRALSRAKARSRTIRSPRDIRRPKLASISRLTPPPESNREARTARLCSRSERNRHS